MSLSAKLGMCASEQSPPLLQDAPYLVYDVLGIPFLEYSIPSGVSVENTIKMWLFAVQRHTNIVWIRCLVYFDIVAAVLLVLKSLFSVFSLPRCPHEEHSPLWRHRAGLTGYINAPCFLNWQTNFEWTHRATTRENRAGAALNNSQTYRRGFYSSQVHTQPDSRVCLDLQFSPSFAFVFLGTMMFTGFNAECDSSSRCSTASPSADTVGYYPSPAGSYSSMGSPQSQVRRLKILHYFIIWIYVTS